MAYETTYSTVLTGEIAGSATAVQLPNIACRRVRFKAVASNAGNVYLGGAGVTIPQGTADATSGWELDATQETPWIPVGNLNKFYLISDNAGDDLMYIALK